MKSFLLLLSFSILIVGNSCIPTGQSNNDNENKIKIFAAASAASVLPSIIDTFQALNNIKVRVNYASSGTLAMAIKQGSPCDLFISADDVWVKYLNNELENTSFQQFTTNRLCLIKSLKSSTLKLNNDFSNLEQLFDNQRVALAEPKLVPLGRYTDQFLKSITLNIEKAERVIYASDAVSVLRLVERNEATYGIVYETDAINSTKIEIVSSIPSNLYDTISYSCLMSTKKEESLLFHNFLQGSIAQDILKKYGFQNSIIQ